MELQLNYIKNNSVMKAGKIKVDKITSVSEKDLSYCIKEIAESQDKGSLATIFNFYAPRLKSYLVKIGAIESHAEEIIQEVMLAIWTKAASYDSSKSSTATWIYTIARNKRIDRLRKEKRHLLSDSDEGLEIPMNATQEEEIYNVQVSQKLRKSIESLPEEQSKLIKMSYFYGKTHIDISKGLNIPLGTVKSRIRLALSKMRHLEELN